MRHVVEGQPARLLGQPPGDHDLRLRDDPVEGQLRIERAVRVEEVRRSRRAGRRCRRVDRPDVLDRLVPELERPERYEIDSALPKNIVRARPVCAVDPVGRRRDQRALELRRRDGLVRGRDLAGQVPARSSQPSTSTAIATARDARRPDPRQQREQRHRRRGSRTAATGGPSSSSTTSGSATAGSRARRRRSRGARRRGRASTRAGSRSPAAASASGSDAHAPRQHGQRAATTKTIGLR